MSRRCGVRRELLAGALTVICGLAGISATGPSAAAVRLIRGPTPIPSGDARAAGDITVINEHLAFALAVQSAVPYGVPRGALVDLAPVTAGVIGRDRVVFADFIPDHWSAWPNTYQHVDILERGPRVVSIRTVRDWGKATITTRYTLRAGADHIEIETTLRNDGAVPLVNLYSGLTLWPNSGYFFSVPGLEGVADGPSDAALAHRVVAYDEDWAVALHATYFDHVGDESMDLYLKNSVAPGASMRVDGWLQVESSGDLKPIVAAEIAHGHLQAGQVHGQVRGRDGTLVEHPVVVIESHGSPYAWVMGHGGAYEVTLPVGEYSLYATARNYSNSASAAVTIKAGSSSAQDFGGLDAPGQLAFTVSAVKPAAASVAASVAAMPTDARISIVTGQKPVVQFLGRTTFFTDLDRPGRLELTIAPGAYEFSVSSGGGFLGPSQRLPVQVEPGGRVAVAVNVNRPFDPPARGWYAADLHHHADQAEAVTPAADLARSELAAGLDVLFVSDHDSTANHALLQTIAARRGVPFLAGIELSPSWGHFNAYPIKPGATLGVDTSVASVDQLFAEARRLGAAVVQANHPFIPYGYLTSVAAGVAPGGFNPAFDLLEINDSAPEDDMKVLRALWGFWNAGERYYLSAGTDTHDVWKSESGHVRAFVHLTGPPTAMAFAHGLRAGHSYVSHGPLIYPQVMFGDDLKVRPGAPVALGFDLESVAGLRSAQLIGAGAVVAEKTFGDSPQRVHVEFPASPAASTWYSLIVEDAAGRRAYTNPVWVETVTYHQEP